MTAVRIDVDRVRGLAAGIAQEAQRVGPPTSAAHDLVIGPAAGIDLPALRWVLADVERVVATLQRLAGLVDLVADEAATLDGRLREGPIVSRARRLTGGPGTAADVVALLRAVGDPRRVAALWRGVAPRVRAAAVAAAPAAIGALDGVDLASRDRANRITVGRRRDDLVTRRVAVDDQARAADRVDDAVAGASRDVLAIRRARLDRAIGALDRILAADRILLWDPDGDGRAAVAWGDPAVATHVTTVVPGMSHSLATFDAVQDDALALHQQVQATVASAFPTPGPDGADGDDEVRVATVAWLGYDAPSGIGWGVGEAARDRRAVEERHHLVDWAVGLRATNPTATHTIVAHSYGSVLLGQAIRGATTPVADRIVVLGSPGMGRGIAAADDLAGHGIQRIVVAASPSDPVPHVPVLGPDPAGFADVERLPLGLDAGGHADYLRPGSHGLAQVARAVLDLPLVRPAGW